ncbi:MAG: hypothetical protein SGARI_001450, partial [Bacillariaceae sp.]
DDIQVHVAKTCEPMIAVALDRIETMTSEQSKFATKEEVQASIHPTLSDALNRIEQVSSGLSKCATKEDLQQAWRRIEQVTVGLSKKEDLQQLQTQVQGLNEKIVSVAEREGSLQSSRAQRVSPETNATVAVFASHTPPTSTCPLQPQSQVHPDGASQILPPQAGDGSAIARSSDEQMQQTATALAGSLHSPNPTSDATKPAAEPPGGGGTVKLTVSIIATAQEPVDQPTTQELEQLEILCREGKWNHILQVVQATPSLGAVCWATQNYSETTLLHRAIRDGGDPAVRAKVISTILAATPHCASIKNAFGSLPLHAICGRQCKLQFALRTQLISQMIHAHPEGLTTTTPNSGKIPLHMGLAEKVIATMLQVAPGSAAVKDKKGYLPLHIACSTKCSLRKVEMLLQAYPESISETTNDGDTPLALAIGTATDCHPNEALIALLSKLNAKRPCDNEAAGRESVKKAKKVHYL